MKPFSENSSILASQGFPYIHINRRCVGCVALYHNETCKERDVLIILSYHHDDVLIILSVILIILGYIWLGLVVQAW